MPVETEAGEGVRHTSNLNPPTQVSANRLNEIASLLTQAATLLSTTNDLHRPVQSQDQSIHKGAPLHPDSQQSPSAVQAVAPGQLTGWAAVEKALTDFDRQEIGAYKEDIDSLLTFTGLYSAVLTAFVIVSYPQLQEDTAGETLQVLRVIANQTATYTILGGQLVNSTAVAPTNAGPFQPSLAAVQINILWFTSLVISLATASFAILVKQWLRSYMAFATASPQGQLRIRHFRRAGLEAWKVFGIASLLPLFLQISLALFFVGLCVFTRDINSAIGNTTLPLVCAWAFLFIAVTISPAFTAHCPYTTPALERITYLFRVHVYPFLPAITKRYILYGVTRTLQAVLQALRCIKDHIILFDMYLLFKRNAEHYGEYTPPKLTEEGDVLKDPQHDLEILAAADALQADDHLLGTVITGALEQSDVNWVQSIEFIMHIISNRIPVDTSETDPVRIRESYLSLPSVVREVIAQIVKLHVIPKVAKAGDTTPHFSENWQSSSRWALCIFLDLNEADAPLRALGLDMAVYDRWMEASLQSYCIAHDHFDLSDPRVDLLWSIACIRIMIHDSTNHESLRELACSRDVILHFPSKVLSRPQGLRLQIMKEAPRALMDNLDSFSARVSVSTFPRSSENVVFLLLITTEAAIKLHHASGSVFAAESGRLKHTVQYLLSMAKHATWEFSWPVRILRLSCVLDFTMLCDILQSPHRDGIEDDSALSKMIHIVAGLYSGDFEPDALPSEIEILKVSVLAVRQICGRNGATRRERVWDHVSVTRWNRTLGYFADMYFQTCHAGGQPPTVLEATLARSLAVRGWAELPFVSFEFAMFAENDVLRTRVPLIPDYFYLMLWVAAGGRTSWIPAYHEQLVRIACMSQKERERIYDEGRRIVQFVASYEKQRSPARQPGNYSVIEAAVDHSVDKDSPQFWND